MSSTIQEETIEAVFRAENPNSYNVDAWLGMSVRPLGSNEWISDPNHDVKVTLTPGLSEHYWRFALPVDMQVGDAAAGESERQWSLL